VPAIHFVVDSGASWHYCRDRRAFFSFVPSTGQRVKVGTAHTYRYGQGSIRATALVDGIMMTTTFDSVYCVPGLAGNLLSLGTLLEDEVIPTWSKDTTTCFLSKRGVTIGVATKMANRLYKLTVHPVTMDTVQVTNTLTAAVVQHAAATAMLPVTPRVELDPYTMWHARLGHIHPKAVKALFEFGMCADHNATSIARSLVLPTVPCEACLKGKHTRSSIGKEVSSRANTRWAVSTSTCADRSQPHQRRWPLRAPPC